MARSIPWIAVFSVLALGACAPPPMQVTSQTNGDSGDATGPATTGATTMPLTSGEPTDGTRGGGGTGDATTGRPGVDSTNGPETGTSDGGNTSTGTPVECKTSDQCGSNQTCSNEGQCVSVCQDWGDGNYDYCLNEWGVPDSGTFCTGSLSPICVQGGLDITQGIFCSSQNCTSSCDCPPPPETGNATVTCGLLTFGKTPDCYLSCANGEDCPDDMYCRNKEYCTHAPRPLSMYGDCGNVDAPCAEGTCEVYQGSTYAMCVATCNDVGMCDAAPPGGNPQTCDGVLVPPNGPECVILCNNDNDCPFSMECVQSTACLWPI